VPVRPTAHGPHPVCGRRWWDSPRGPGASGRQRPSPRRRNNSIIDSGRYSIESTSATELLIKGNSISQRDPGIAIKAIDLRGTIKDNTIDGANVGVQLGGRATPTIIGNSIDTDGVAFEVVEDVDAVITGNELCAANAIVAVGRDVDPPDVSDNTICEGVPVTFER
jgi:hypothetical protein